MLCLRHLPFTLRLWYPVTIERDTLRHSSSSLRLRLPYTNTHTCKSRRLPRYPGKHGYHVQSPRTPEQDCKSPLRRLFGSTFLRYESSWPEVSSLAILSHLIANSTPYLLQCHAIHVRTYSYLTTFYSALDRLHLPRTSFAHTHVLRFLRFTAYLNNISLNCIAFWPPSVEGVPPRHTDTVWKLELSQNLDLVRDPSARPELNVSKYRRII